MVTVCAWCQKFLGLKEPATQSNVSHGICKTCAARQNIEGFPIVVVSRRRADTVPVLEALLQGSPEIRIVVDRRQSERRQDRVSIHAPDGRRVLRDRREGVAVLLA